ncbi:MAG: DUF4160 domain-containing protein [Candidatus Marinimicrobia bacterium]|nr:DUF4160 domain-containing protein [Candidatus Neomarinimicrobiota bacterium]
MPTLSIFYGIIITMYYFDDKEHHLPHFHANYGEYDIVISINEGQIIKGNFPKNKLKLVMAWAEIHKEDLLANWKLAVDGNLLHKIEPLR